MKKIEAIVRPDKVNDVLDALDSVGIEGITTSEVQGRGHRKDCAETDPDHEHHPGLLPKVKVEAVIQDSRVDDAVETVLKAAETGRIGDGKLFIEPVEQAIRIRSCESGPQAL